jgi:TPR repeat protein
VKQDDDKAAYYLEQAAAAYRKGHQSGSRDLNRAEGARAMFKLAQRFRKGRGVRLDSTKAVDWYAKAAIKGLPKARLCLGLCYLQGEGVPKDEGIGARQVELAAKRGCKEAIFNYGLLLMQGRGLKRDPVAARKWLLTGAMRGDVDCMVNVGVCMAHGLGGDVDDKQARRWLLEAVETAQHAEHAGPAAGQALYNLAVLARDGRGGTDADGCTALSFLRRAAAANYTPAMVDLAQHLLLLQDTNSEDRSGGSGGGGGGGRDDAGADAWGPGSGEAEGAMTGKEAEEEAMALLRRASDPVGPADVESMVVLAAHLAKGGGGGGEASDEEAARLYAEAVGRGADKGCVDLAWLERVARRAKAKMVSGAGGIDVPGAVRLYIDIVGSLPPPGGAGAVREDEGDAGGGGRESDSRLARIKGGRSARGRGEGGEGGEDGEGGEGLVVGGVEGSGGAVVVSDKKRRRQETLATMLMRHMAEAGSIEFKYKYGQLLLAGKERSARAQDGAEDADAGAAGTGLTLIEEAAAGGYADAMHFMASAHASGKHGFPPSDLAAVEWLARAAEAGHAEAQFKLGVFHEYGRGVSKDLFMATEWYRAAAEQGNADAQFALGVALGKGKGVEKSHEQACYWYAQSAMQDNGKAQWNLALRYTEGLGCVKDARKAAYWFARAALNGVAGRGASVRKGVMQNAAKREIAQDMPDQNSGQQAQRPAQTQRMMKLSDFNAIRWNRNPKGFRDGSARDRADFVRAEGKKMPRSVIVDDPKADDYGSVYLTRPNMEARERAITDLLLAHGLDWEAMLLDHERNPFGWAKTELRRRAGKLLRKRLASPHAWLFKHERRQLPRMRALAAEMAADKERKRKTLEDARASIARLQSRWEAAVGAGGKGGGVQQRVLQMREAQEFVDSWLEGAPDGRGGAARVAPPALRTGVGGGGGEDGWDGREGVLVRVNGVEVTTRPSVRSGDDQSRGEGLGLLGSAEHAAALALGSRDSGTCGSGEVAAALQGEGSLVCVPLDEEQRLQHVSEQRLMGPDMRPCDGQVLGSEDLQVSDRAALVAAARRSGVAVDGPIPVPTFLLANLHQQLLRKRQLQEDLAGGHAGYPSFRIVEGTP